MLRPSDSAFTFPARRAPSHRLALGGMLGGIGLAGAALFAPGAGALTDEGLASALPLSLFALVVVLAGLLAWLGRGGA